MSIYYKIEEEEIQREGGRETDEIFETMDLNHALFSRLHLFPLILPGNNGMGWVTDRF